jgi:hypothetical protein
MIANSINGCLSMLFCVFSSAFYKNTSERFQDTSQEWGVSEALSCARAIEVHENIEAAINP